MDILRIYVIVHFGISVGSACTRFVDSTVVVSLSRYWYSTMTGTICDVTGLHTVSYSVSMDNTSPSNFRHTFPARIIPNDRHHSFSESFGIKIPCRLETSLGQYDLHILLSSMSLDPGSSLIFVGQSSLGSAIHSTIEDWATQHGVTTMFLEMHVFEQGLTGLIQDTMQNNQGNKIYGKLFNFVVFCDGVDNCLPRITNISSRIDKEYGKRTLLRHFSKWLLLNVIPPVLSEVYADVDNIAIAVKEANISGSTSIITLLWKPNSREWTQIDDLMNNGHTAPSSNANLFPNLAFMLNGRKLKIGILEWGQFCAKSAWRTNGSVMYNGVCKDLFDNLAECLNFTYELMEPPDQSWGELSGTWSGLLGMVARNDIDLAGIPYGITLKRSESFTFPHIMYQSECEVVHKKLSNVDNNWMLMLFCFKREVYVCGLLTMVWCIGLYVLMERYTVVEEGEISICPPATSDVVMTVVRVPLLQGTLHPPQYTRGRILYASWWLFCIIVLAVYTGNLVAILSVVEENIPFSTIDELAENGDFKILVSKGSFQEDMYMHSNDSVGRKIWRKVLETRSAKDLNSLDEDQYYRTLIQSGYYAYIGSSNTIDGIEKSVDNLRRMKCSTGPNYLSLPFPANSPLADIFSDKISHLYENGLLEAWAGKWSLRKKEESVQARKKVRLSDMFSALIMCAIGIAVAFIVLGIERFLTNRMKKD